jgi:hypothetical protein
VKYFLVYTDLDIKGYGMDFMLAKFLNNVVGFSWLVACFQGQKLLIGIDRHPVSYNLAPVTK